MAQNTDWLKDFERVDEPVSNAGALVVGGEPEKPEEKFVTLTGILELLGGLGMLIGFMFDNILLISSGGLTLLMMLGFIVRLKVKDGFWLSFPSFFFMILNLCVFLIVI